MAIIPEIIEQHATSAAFLWQRRDAAVGAAHYRLESLAELDERVDARLDALRVAGPEGFAICKAKLAGGEEGELFVATVLAAEQRDLETLAGVLDLGGASPELSRGIASALGWVEAEALRPLLAGLLDPACPAPLHRLGIAACAAHRLDPGGALLDAVASPDLPLKARALRAVGELGRRDLVGYLSDQLGAEDDACRFAAASSAALLGESAAFPVLWAFAAKGGRWAARACALVLRGAPLEAGRARVAELAARPARRREAVIGAGALGDPGLVPWLLGQLDAPELARRVGEAFTLIAGPDLAATRLAGKAPEGFHAGPTDDPADDDVALDPDEHLPWPAPGALDGWWRKHGTSLDLRARHLLGKPVSTPAWLEGVLRDGTQRQRAAAALELALRAPGRPLFEVRAPGSRQRRMLGAT